MRIIILGIAFFCSLFTFACDPPKGVTIERLFLVNPEGAPKYDLNNPEEKYFLPYVLEEISGLSFVEDGILACVQDEDGKLFFYNYHEKKVALSLKFWKPGDYEGVEVIGDSAYIVNSKGDLFVFNYKGQEGSLGTQKIDTPLSRKNDVEGLAYDHSKGNLLLMCKADSEISKEKVDGQASYKFNLAERKFSKKPLFSITKKKIKHFLEDNKDSIYEEKKINFRPSGIALHPINNHFYIIASTGKLLLVVNRKGEIQSSYPIPRSKLGQPEGICFAPNGDMFISSEGQGDKGYILRFTMK